MSENLAAMSIRNLMDDAQESIRGMKDISSTQLHHLTSELNAILDEINRNPDTKIVKNIVFKTLINKEHKLSLEQLHPEDITLIIVIP